MQLNWKIIKKRYDKLPQTKSTTKQFLKRTIKQVMKGMKEDIPCKNPHNCHRCSQNILLNKIIDIKIKLFFY